MNAAKRFFRQRGNAAGHISRRRISAPYILTRFLISFLFPVKNCLVNLFSDFRSSSVLTQNMLRADALHGLAQDRGTAGIDHLVGDKPQHRIRREAGGWIGAAAFQSQDQI